MRLFFLILTGCVLASALPAQTNPATFVTLAGTFNEWNPGDPAYRMTETSNGTYRLTKFFRKGNYKFKFAFDGGWERDRKSTRLNSSHRL